MRERRQTGCTGNSDVASEARRRQEDERLVLQSIYGDDLVDAMPNAWKIWRPLDLILHLKPVGSASVTSGKIYVSLDLHVKCPATYPLSGTPLLLLENVKGVARKDVEKLKQTLDNKAMMLSGNEIILELCQIVQEFLYERNKPPEGSFFDGMLQLQAASEHERKRQRVKSEQRAVEDVIEFQKKQEENLMWRKVEESPAAVTASSSLDDAACPRIFLLPQTLNFEKGCGFFFGLQDRELFISEWTFIASAKSALHSFKAFIASLNELEAKMRLISQITISQPALYSYELLSVQRNKLTPSEVNVRIIFGQNINASDKNLPSQIDIFETDMMLLVRLATQLLNGLQLLHDNSIAHLSLDLRSVWLTTKRNFRLSDYFLR
ncbi:unnamed protein product [Gongylonema pulchrum]|uniref:RWD domain-containing protein n=1 Tax=Gongylonema pulchrum TaxID=637853 RepID=A0A183DS62_9BILA|nr:unnamed protein product [Gongylonema pulchrum]